MVVTVSKFDVLFKLANKLDKPFKVFIITALIRQQAWLEKCQMSTPFIYFQNHKHMQKN